MRKILFLFCTLLGFCACSDDDTATPQLTFPETQIVNCTAGTTQSLTFIAPADWKLSSSASWCRFMNGDEKLLSLTGDAGEQTVTLVISDEGLTQGEGSQARLMLYMNGQQGVLAELNRSAAGYDLQIFDAEGNEVHEIVVPYGDYVVFTVRANFAFAATNLPEWAELRGGWLTGTPDRDVEGALRIVDNAVNVANEASGTMLFQDVKGMASIAVPVIYNGMDRDAILINQPAGSAINWMVNADGKTWIHEGATYDNFITCSITAYNNDYEVVYVSESDHECTIMTEADSWLHLDKATGRITADASDEACLSADKARRAFVLALPRATYTAIANHLAETLIVDNELAYVYAQNNLVVYVKQQAPGSGEGSGEGTGDVGFVAMCFDADWNMLEVNCYRITDTPLLDQCEQIVNTRDIYLLDFRSPRGHFDMVTPYPYLSNLDDIDPENLWFYDLHGNRLEDNIPEAMFADTNNPACWAIMGCANSDVPLLMPIYNTQGEVIKALYILTVSF